MKDKFPEIYKNKIENLKSKIQNDFYYHADAKTNEDKKRNDDESQVRNREEPDRISLMKKINNIFKRPDYVYQADVNIMYKNGENIEEKIVGVKDNYLISKDGSRIYIDNISDIK